MNEIRNKIRKIIATTNDKKIIFVFLCFYAVLYIFLLNENKNHLHDSYTYFYLMIENNWKWYGNHLLYEPFLWGWYHLWRPLIPVPWLSDFKLASTFQTVTGVLGLGMIYKIIREHLYFDKEYSILTIFTLGFSFYFLTYSTNIEIYIPALLLMLITMYHVFKNKIQISSLFLIGVLHGFAMLMHQMSFLLGFAIIWHYRQHLRLLWAYVLGGSLVVVAGYVAIASLLGIHNLQDFSVFFMGYLNKESDLFTSNTVPAYAAIFGYCSALLGGRYLISLPFIENYLVVHFPDTSFERMAYLHHKTGLLGGVVQLLAYAVFAICACLLIKNTYKNWKTTPNSQFFIVVLLVYTLFFMNWYPHNTDFWVMQMIASVILVIAMKPCKKLLSVACICVIVINILGSALPLKDPKNDMFAGVKDYHKALYDYKLKKHIDLGIEKQKRIHENLVK